MMLRFLRQFERQLWCPAGNAGGFGRASLLVAAALSICTLNLRAAHAQIDTPAAREARAALRNIVDSYSARPGWSTWSRRLGVDDVEYELRLGERAEPAVLQATAAQLRAGAATDYRAAAVQQLAADLEARVAELAPIPAEQWPDECVHQAERYAPVTPEAVQASRQELLERLNALERRLPSLARPDDPWAVFLFWSPTRALVTTDVRDPGLLDQLEARWQGAPLIWNNPELLEASLAVRSYVQLYRAYLANESPEQYAAAWTALGALLQSNLDATSPASDRIAELVNQRERLGQGSALTASIRRQFSRPNVVLQVRTPWLERQLAERINERYEVNDVYAGARATGSGVLSGTMRCEILPSTSVGHAKFLLDATSRARTASSSEGVSVSSTASTTIHGEKSFALDSQGMSARPATVTADTSITYNSIDAPGLRRRREEATRRTYARRATAERDAEAATRREIAARMNADGDGLVTAFNRAYTQLRDRQFDLHRRAPEIRVRANADVMQVECRLETPSLFAAPTEPPPFEPTANVTLSIAASALEEQCLAALAGRQLSGSELSKTIGELLGTPADKSARVQDFRATFAEHPCDVQFASGQVRAKFYVTSFIADDVEYPAMTVDAEYNVEGRNGSLALVRQGSLRVRPLAERGEATPALSGRQQTLRLAAQRKLNRALAETYLWAGPAWETAGRQPKTLPILRVSVERGWLQLAFGEPPAPSGPREVKWQPDASSR